MVRRSLLSPSITWSALVLLLMVVCLPAAGLAQQPVYEANVQAVHPNGTVLGVSKVIYEPTHTAIQVRVTNGYLFPISLNNNFQDTVLRDAAGTRYRLSPPTDNQRLVVPAGEALEGTLIFLGGIPAGSTAVTLIVNEAGTKAGTMTDRHTPFPRFDIKLPLKAEEPEQKKIPQQIDPPGEASSVVRIVALPRAELRPVATLRSEVDRGEPLKSEVDRVAQLKSEQAATQVPRGTLVSLPGDVLFDFDRADIRPDAVSTLRKVAELIVHSGDAPVAIEGHTDSIGTAKYNQKLSERRAAAVQDYLIGRHGIAPDRLTTRGYGFSRPVAPNTHPDGTDSPQGRQRNRRVEIVIGTD